jgi:RHS repeat-associated protein
LWKVRREEDMSRQAKSDIVVSHAKKQISVESCAPELKDGDTIVSGNRDAPFYHLRVYGSLARRTLGVLTSVVTAFLLLSLAIGQPILASPADSGNSLSVDDDLAEESSDSIGQTGDMERPQMTPIVDDTVAFDGIESGNVNGGPGVPEYTDFELGLNDPFKREPVFKKDFTSIVRHSVNDGVHKYKTPFGRYVFDENEPHSAKVIDRRGRILVDGATFYIMAPSRLDIFDSQIVVADDLRFVVQYSAYHEDRSMGLVTIESDFSVQGPPKITATLDVNPEIPRYDFHIMWEVFSGLDCLSTGDRSEDLDLNGRVLWLSGGIHSNVRMGECDDRVEIGPSLLIDWEGAPSDHFEARRITSEGSVLSKVEVHFQKNQKVIDPELVDGTNPNESTFSIQRKTFYLNRYYWAFYLDTTNEAIWYSTSRDGLSWNQPLEVISVDDLCPSGMTCFLNGDPAGLDVAVQSSLIAMTFTFEYEGGWPHTHYVTVGVVYGIARVNELLNIGYTSLPVDEKRLGDDRGINDALSVTIDYDGHIWASASYLSWRATPGMWDIRARVWELEDEGWTFRDEHRRNDVDANTIRLTTKLVPMSRDKVAWFWSESDDDKLYWKIWEEGWSLENSRQVGFPSANTRANIMSIVSLSDETLVVAFGRQGILNPTYVSLLKITETTEDQKDVCDALNCFPRYITISRDALDTIFVYWMDIVGGEIHYWYEMDGWESEIEDNIKTHSAGGPYPVSASFLATDYSYFVYYDDGSPGIWFASWPSPQTVLSGNSAPWKNLGSAAFPGTYSHLDESISMANGLLSVRQTDLLVPGKNGLDLEISRIFRTPQLFRESLVGGPDIPYMFYRSPYADLGIGWELNFPWIELNTANPGDVLMLHFGNGIRFLLNFPDNENTIENHNGLHFTIGRNPGACGNRCYVMTLVSGLTYVFRDDGYLYQITSRHFDPRSDITFHYGSSGLNSIVDSLGKTVSFQYVGGRLERILRGPNLVVVFGYNSGYLETIEDAVGRVTQVYYGPDIPVNNNDLIRQIVYSTGARSDFLYYARILRGTETHFFSVLTHNIDSAASGDLKRSSFTYIDSDGSIRFTRHNQFEYVGGSPVQKRCDDFMFDSASNSMTVIQRDPAGGCTLQMGKSRQWFDSKAQLTQTDYYAGDSEFVSSSVTYEYDDWGNIIYERDRLEHETWRTYANTASQNSFVGGGVLKELANKNILYDDFIEYDLSEWREDMSANPPSEDFHLDEVNYLVSPRSLGVRDFGYGISREFESSFDELWVEVALKLDGSVDHDLYILDQSNNPRLRITFARTGYIVMNYQAWSPTPNPCNPSDPADPCSAIWNYEEYLMYHEQVWYTLGLHLKEGSMGHVSGSVDVYLNGTLVLEDADLWYHFSRTFSRILFETQDFQGGDMWIDSVSINDFTDPSDPENYFGISINGLESSQYSELSSYDGRVIDRKRADPSGRVDLGWWNPEKGEWDFMRYGVIRIFDLDGTRKYSSPFRITGSKQYDFVQPRHYSNLEKTASGFDIVEQDSGPDRCDWNPDNKCVLLDEASEMGYVAVDDHFDSSQLDTEEFKVRTGRNGYYDISSSWLELNSGTWVTGGGYARLTSKESFSLTKVMSLYFEGRIRSFHHPDVAPPQDIYGDGQPRGFRVGTDGRNAIEFVAIDRHTVESVTIANGFAERYQLVLPGGREVDSPDITYQIFATLNSVEFHINGEWRATHTQHIPTGELNLYLSAESQSMDVWIKADWLVAAIAGIGWPASSPNEISNGDYWIWPDEREILGVHGIDAHKSKHNPSERYREFHNVQESKRILVDSGEDLFVQYVYIPSYDPPDEIMLRYWCGETTGDWGAGAFWGENLIGGSFGKSPQGDMPKPDQWTLLVISPIDVECDDGDLDEDLGGIMYMSYGGQVYWDYSILRDRASASVKVVGNDLQTGWDVELYDVDGDLLDTETVSGNTATFDLLNRLKADIRAYPVTGYFKILDSSELIYQSPIIEKIWPGDEFTFTTPEFYPNEEILSHNGYQNRLLGSLEYSFGRLNGPSESGPVKSFYKYNERDFIAEDKANYWESWMYQTYTYDTDDNLQTFCDFPLVGGGCESGHLTEYDYDPNFDNAYLTEVQQWADGQSILTEYWYNDLTGALEYEINPRGYQTDYEYDAVQRLTKVTYPQVDGEPNRPFVEYQYDDINNKMVYIPERYTTGDIRYRTEYYYDELGRTAEVATLHESVDGSGAKYVYELYEHNWLDKVTVRELRRGSDGALLRRDVSDYDALGRIIEEIPTAPLAGSKTYEYDDEQNMVVLEYVVGLNTLHEKEYHYDWNGQLLMVKEVEDGNEHDTFYQYDELGNLIEMINAESQSTEYTYDSLSRLTVVRFPDGESELYVYDDAGDLEREYDRNGIVTHYTYDSLHRVTRIDYDYPTGNRWTTFDYDANSNVMAKAKYKGGYGFESSLMYQYDERDNVIFKQVDEMPDSSFVGIGFYMFSYYGYDRSNNLVDIDINPSSGLHTIYHLDEFDRTSFVTREVDSSEEVIADFTYFENSAIKEIIYDNGVKTTYSYYESGLQEMMEVEYFGQNYLTLDYDYYDDGLPKFLTHDYGLTGPVSQEFQYDELSRLTHFDPDKDDPGILPTTFGYDSVGNRIIKLNAEGTFDYHYEETTNRLESIDWQELGYPFPYYEFEYDLNGNLVKETNNDPGYTKCFDYDYEDQLIGYRYTDGIPPSCQEVPLTEEYFYDADGRRVIRAKADGQVVYGYSGSVPVLVGDSATGQGSNFVWVNGLLIAEYSTTGSIWFHHQDALGNVRVITDQSGMVISETNYEPFGEPMGSSPGRFKFGAKEKDDSGLYYFGVRFYDPQIGRFITEDPVMGSPKNPQSLNQYAYALNSPLAYTDPVGAFPFLILAIFAIGFALGSGSYSITAGDDWNLGDFLRAGIVGGVVSALSAGTGAWIGAIAPSAGWAVFGGALLGGLIGAEGYALDRLIEYAQTGTFEWDWGQFGLSVAMGAISGAIGGYSAFKSRPQVRVNNQRGQAFENKVNSKFNLQPNRGPGRTVITNSEGTWIPDNPGLSGGMGEVKAVTGKLAFTKQLRVAAQHARTSGQPVDLFVLRETTFTGPLENAIFGGDELLFNLIRV